MSLIIKTLYRDETYAGLDFFKGPTLQKDFRFFIFY